jgi:hypothetical protein
MAEDQPPNRDGGPEVTAADVYDFFSGLFKRFIAGVLSSEGDQDPWRQHFRRFAIGATGGFFYTAFKNYFAAGIGVYGIWTMDPGSARRGELMFGYFCSYLVSIVAGGVTGWLSAQKSGRLLFLIGVFGVLILLTIFPSLQSKSSEKVGWLIEELRPIIPAHAQTGDECVGDSAFAKGFKAGFGVRDHYDKYAVIVASGTSLADARAKLKAISAQHPSLTLRVGPRPCDNDYYPVFASDYLPLNEAKALLDKIRESSGVSDAFLSPGPLPLY